MVFEIAYVYGANFIAKFRWKSDFSQGIPWTPPWASTGVKYLGHLVLFNKTIRISLYQANTLKLVMVLRRAWALKVGPIQVFNQVLM